MQRRVPNALILFVVLILASSSPMLLAQSQEVIVSSSNNKFVSVDFETLQVEDIFAAPAGTNLRQLGVRQDSDDTICILATSQDSEVAIYDRTTGVAQQIADVQDGDGLAISADGDALIITETMGGPDSFVFVPRNLGGPSGCVAGGYLSQRFIDSQVDGATLLADVKVANITTGIFDAGDVLVLIRKRTAKIVRYAAEALEERRGTNPPGDATPSTVLNLSELDPVAFAVTPFGEILVALSSGEFRRFGKTGQPINDPTLPTVPGTPVNLAGGTDDFGADSGIPAAFVTFATGGDGVVRYRIQDNGTLTFPTVVTSSLPSAQGVGSASLTSVAFTPVSAAGVTVRTTATELTFEEVTDAGLTLFRHFSFIDPRTDPNTDDLPLSQVGGLPPEAANSNAIIPAGVVPMVGDEFHLFVGTTTAIFDGVNAAHTVQETLGLSLACDAFNSPAPPDPNPAGFSLEPRMYQAASANETPVFPSRDGLFFDVTSGCASCCLWTSHRKCLFLAAKSNLNHTERITEKLGVLRAEFDAGKSCIQGGQRTKLEKALDDAEEAFFVDGDYATAFSKLETFKSLAQNESAFSNCAGNFDAELIAITNTTLWDLQKLF